MAEKKTLDFKNLEIDLSEVNAIQNMISDTVFGNSLANLNYMRTDFNEEIGSSLTLSGVNGNLEFVSVNKNQAFKNMLTEKELFKILGVTKNGISKKSGKYQEYLYGLYLRALKENDKAFMSEIYNKVIVFRNNLNYVKMLSKKTSCIKKWKAIYGNLSPIKIFKETGDLSKISILAEANK